MGEKETIEYRGEKYEVLTSGEAGAKRQIDEVLYLKKAKPGLKDLLKEGMFVYGSTIGGNFDHLQLLQFLRFDCDYDLIVKDFFGNEWFLSQRRVLSVYSKDFTFGGFGTLVWSKDAETPKTSTNTKCEIARAVDLAEKQAPGMPTLEVGMMVEANPCGVSSHYFLTLEKNDGSDIPWLGRSKLGCIFWFKEEDVRRVYDKHGTLIWSRDEVK
jgi:hypothetical protein